MNADQLALWQRIRSHTFDDPTVTLPFSLRLVKENGWSLGFARQAIEEYRRFAFLAVAGGHSVSPPDAIDQVWHLHLLYTRDYWGEFCPNVLRMPLHHGPTRGGAKESGKFADWYAHTRASYARFFGEPPSALWPERPSHPRSARVNLETNWVIPKLRWWRRAPAPSPRSVETRPTPSARNPTVAAVAAVVLAFAFLPHRADAASINSSWPLNLPGSEFLDFFYCFAALMLALAWGVRWIFSRGPSTPPAMAKIDPYETAHLAGGKNRVLSAVIATLNKRSLVKFERQLLVRSQPQDVPNLSLLEGVVLAAIPAEGIALRDLGRAVDHALEANAATLEKSGLVLSNGTASAIHRGALALALTGPLVGCIKITLGLLRDRPVALLAIPTVFSLLIALWYFRRRPRVTRHGEATLRHLETEYEPLAALDERTLAGPESATLLPLAVGLFGLSALRGTPMHPLERKLQPLETPQGNDAQSGSSDGYGTDSDSGGDGCGGCSSD